MSLLFLLHKIVRTTQGSILKSLCDFCGAPFITIAITSLLYFHIFVQYKYIYTEYNLLGIIKLVNRSREISIVFDFQGLYHPKLYIP